MTVSRRVLRVPAGTPGTILELQERGEALAVVRGGWPGTRIFFDNPTESVLGSSSVAAATGLVVAQTFERLFVVWGDVVAPHELELECYSCAHAVVPLVQAGSVPPHRYLAVQADLTVEEPGTLPGYNPVPIYTMDRTALENLGQTTRWHSFPELLIGGGMTSSRAMRAHFWAPLPGTNDRVYLGRIDASQADPSGRFSASFELGLQRTNRSLSTNVQTDLVTQPWRIPRTGLHVELDYIAAAASGDATVHFGLYAWER